MNLLSGIELRPLRHSNGEQEIRVRKRRTTTVHANEDIQHTLKILFGLFVVADDFFKVNRAVEMAQHPLRLLALVEAEIKIVQAIEQIILTLDQDTTDAKPQLAISC